MPEDKTPEVQEAVSENTSKETEQSSSTDQHIAESKKYRKRAQDAEARLAEYEDSAKKAKESKMIEEGKKDEVITNLIAERDKFKASHEKLSSYEQKRMATMLEKHPEEDREQLSKLDLDTLEYVTNKINNIKPNAPEVAGNARKKGLEKPYSEMTEKEKKENWGIILQQFKPGN